MSRRTLAFLAANASYVHTNLAASCLRVCTDLDRWEWHTIETTVNDDQWSTLERLIAVAPDVLAVSVYLFNRTFVARLLRRFRILRPECVIIGGGPEFLGSNEDVIMRDAWCDVIIRGEGEIAFRAWLDHFDEPSRWRTIPGVCFRDGARYHDGGSAVSPEPLDDLPSPFEMTGEVTKPFLQLETSRGCANTCSFCTSGGGRVRRFSFDRVRSELATIRTTRVRQVRIVDRTFNDDPRRCLRLLAMMRDDFNDMAFHLEIDPARVTPALCAALADTAPGRFHLEAGVQSLQPAVYRAIGRRATVRRTLDGLSRLCALRRPAIHVDLIAGLPLATREGLLDDLRQVVRLGPDAIQIELLKVLPGTALRRDAQRLGLRFAPEPPYEILATPTMPHADLQWARRLILAVDWFYNPVALQPVIRQAAAAAADCWPRLVGFIIGRYAATTAPGLDARFKALDEFFNGDLAPCRQRLHYAWIFNGFSARHGIANATGWKGAIPAGAVVVEGDAAIPATRFVCATFDADYIFAFTAGEGAGRRACAVYRL
jgi:hypothetical protein